ncbi:phosphatidic acid phosphatase [Flavobacterium branchiophilum NBRC 15030 = ATCC 35035]|uniref:Membrane-associated phospholipid phosphatase n=1 Tax=Flavobacterium branchiophilum TaxID=55197 RepID=A0A2H3KCZ3_9FLAO|nr:phosphatase PAP2 family protein [Flavobacterium branchiophilum]OXA79217.1 phosphatidic acid phosphatase [Flavobacterium branchiophilum NBRC 15030 = ATCC 35035]PDS25393.1 phosphatase PAP2 family protein [Flavobacterium branchiophilum]TQM40298.1 membrane-associated phospholipid phosphatase [Flavobacterium branchiophilum]GEM53995.1 phospholipid phosphatase [Flavobacterium branchiophilum NBRC 15030 = ATCC 35035]
MKTKWLILFFILNVATFFAQQTDSIQNFKPSKTCHFKFFIVPTALISSGFLLLHTNENQHLQTEIRTIFGQDFQTKIDNYTQFVPLVQVYGGRYLGFKPQNNVLHQSINLAVANLIMGTVVGTMKHSFSAQRPDASNNLSFPSGHTATAFTNASILFYEYKDSNLWYASSGYLFATATGLLRIANNKHYTSDVLTGAGIGMGIGLAVSYWNPFKSLQFHKNKKTQALLYPQVGTQYGLGLLIRMP